jgi:hypothetical protein
LARRRIDQPSDAGLEQVFQPDHEAVELADLADREQHAWHE